MVFLDTQRRDSYVDDLRVGGNAGGNVMTDVVGKDESIVTTPMGRHAKSPKMACLSSLTWTLSSIRTATTKPNRGRPVFVEIQEHG
jgi:hypothetical protein